jgi:uncharacterized membrane protein
MAMKEIRSIEVQPADEEITVQLWMSFGWELKNNQRVKTQDVQKYTGQDNEGTSYFETTRGVDFIKLTFERDPERKNYAELVELENQYNLPLPSIPSSVPSPPAQPRRLGLLQVIITVVGLILINFFIPGINNNIIKILSIVAVAIIIFRFISSPKKLKEWTQKKEAYEAYEKYLPEAEKALSEAMRKHSDVLQKARSLV